MTATMAGSRDPVSEFEADSQENSKNRPLPTNVAQGSMEKLPVLDPAESSSTTGETVIGPDMTESDITEENSDNDRGSVEPKSSRRAPTDKEEGHKAVESEKEEQDNPNRLATTSKDLENGFQKLDPDGNFDFDESKVPHKIENKTA
ncbi:MAG: hypothetical protein JSW39_19820, partial [Desulfobacterales bacterium]